MAENDSAVGVILEIPPQALRSIEKAEKAIKSLKDTSEKAARSIYNDFATTMPKGVDAFINKLAEAKERLEAVGKTNVTLNTQQAVQAGERLSSQMQRTSMDVSQAIQSIASLPVDTSSIASLAMSAEQAGATFKQLEQLVKNYERGRSQTAVESPEAMAMNNAIEKLKEYIALRKKSDEQLARAKTDPEKDYLAEQKRLMTDLLNIRKQINAQSTKVQTGRITGNEKIKEEEEDLRRLFARYQESYRALQTLNAEKGKDLGAAARTEAEVNAEKYKTEVLKQQIAYRQKLSAEITRANELTAQGQQGKTRLGSGEEAAIQRQLNSDYKNMLKIIKEQGVIKAKVAAEGRRMTQEEISLIAALGRRYKIYYDDVNRISDAYKNMAASAERAFASDRSEQLARNAILLADAKRKAAEATQKQEEAERKAAEAAQQKALTAAKLAGQQYAQSYAGAMKQFENMMTGNASGKLTVNLENIKRVLNDLQTAAGKLNLLDPADASKAERLKKAIQELNRIVQQYKTVTSAKPEKPLISPTDAVNAAKSARTLQELQTAYKNLKAVMANTDPKSAQWEAMNKAYSDTKAKIDEIKDAMGELHTQSQRTSGIMGQLQNRIAAAFSAQAIMGFIKKMVETRAEFELQNIALRAILQNKDEADRIFAQVQQMAMQSPFSIMQLNTYAKQLAAYRVESEKLLGTTKMLADVSAGLGVDMQRLILAYGQVKSANYLRATEVRQFTEAGLNIAGELASYFSELKGEMITVGDVMEMITKRMVKFKDVEEVFKRVTGAGGIFYDMQRKQSDSLRGQMQRIVDATSIMMNEIGESNQSVIGSMLTLIRTLIQNWKVFVNLLYGAGAAMTVYAVKATLAATAQGAFNASSKGLVGVLAKVKDSLKGMIDTLAKNPYAVLIGAAVTAGMALYDLNKKTNEVKASYDKIITGIAESSNKLEDIAKKIEDTQQKIDSTKKGMSSLAKGTDEYTAAAEANKTAVIEQNRALQELRDKFPEVYAEIRNTADKTGALTDAVREFYEVVRGSSVIATRMKGRAGWFNDDFKEDFKEVSEEQDKYNAALVEAEAYYNALMAQATALYNTRKAEGNLTKEQEAAYRRLLNIRNSTLSTEQKLNAAHDLTRRQGQLLGVEANEFSKAILRFANIKNALVGPLREAESEAAAVMNDIMLTAGTTTVEGFKKLPPEAKKAAQDAGQKVISELGLALDDVQRDIIRRKIEIPLGISFNFGTNTAQPLSHVQELINKYIKEHGLTIEPIQATDNLDQYFNSVKQQQEQGLKDAKRYNNAKVQLDTKSTNAQLANAEKLKAEELKAFRAYFGYIDEEKKRSGSGKDPLLELFKNRLKAIKDFYKQYEELQKNYSDEEALRRAQSAYEKLFKTLKIDMSEVVGRGMDKKGLAANIEQLLAAVRKFRPQLTDEVEKELADVEVQIGLKIQTNAVEDMKKQMQEVADNFELSETFSKLGVSTDLVFMLGGKPTTLADYRKTLEDTYKQTFLIQEEYGKEGVKAYEEQLKKIEQLEQKNAIERAKNYVRYLTESVGERAQIELKAMQDINKIRNDETLDDFSKEQATMQRRKKMMEDLAKVDMDNLKSSDVYVQVFKDLEKASKEQLQYVIDKLKELQSTFKDLSPAQVRSLANDMRKLEDAIADKDSFKNIGSNIVNVISFQRRRNELLKEQARLQGILEQRNKSLSAAEVALNGLILKRDSIQNKNTKEWADANSEVEKQQRLISGLQSQIVFLTNELKKYTGEIEDGESATKRLGKAFADVSNIMNSSSSLIGDMATGLENMGLMTEGMADAFQSAQDVIGGALQTAEGVLQAFTATDPISKVQGAFQALGGVISLVGSAFAIGDKKKERQIKRLQERVDDLGKAYENLHDAMEEAYRFDDYNAVFEASIKNLDAQTKAYDEMIRLEKAKKNTDKDKLKQYEEAREEIEKARKELIEARYEEYGSITQKNYLDEAEAFVSAWLDAYKETGDGLDGLIEHWDEFFNNLVMKQAASSIVSNRMKKYIDAINAAIDSGDTGLSLSQTFKEIGDRFKDEMGEINANLKEFFDALGYNGGAGDFLLSDLQKGIQNITEPQAAAIEAYMNSIRFAVFRHTEQLDILITTIQAQYGAGTDNPVVGELRGIRSVLDNIYASLRSVIVTGRGNAALRIS